MKDYKNTLNLPTTDFPMKADLAKREPEILRRWDQIHLYQKIQQQGKDRPSFILHDGPPYANGTIHLGTALNKILKDIVVKSKILSGFRSPFVPGWDCHGLPIESMVEKKVGKAGVKLTHKEFRKACRDFAQSQVELQKADFIRLGVLGDWSNPYLTMNYSYEANVIRSLSKIIANGYVVRGRKPVYWCTDCGSALAEAEVEYKDKSSPAIDVAFYAVDPHSVFNRYRQNSMEYPASFPIWTTTPWTLPANQAVAVNPDFEYVLVKCELNQRVQCIVVAESLLTQVMHRFGVHAFEALGSIKGSALEGIQLKHPFLDRIVPIVLGEHVTADAGTGNVHTAPAHGPDDFALGEKYHLPSDNPVDSRSCFSSEIPIVGGMHVFKANEPIIVALSESGHLLHHEAMTHSYPHCWRHKTPLIFRATPQWFISLERNNLRVMAHQEIGQVQWIPNWGETRIGKMIEGRPDWCISRQRTWGTPIALFIHKKTEEMHPDTMRLMNEAANLVEKEGVDAWYELDPQTLLGKEAQDYDKVTDILDVWFDSGVSHACVLEHNPELRVPADLYLEGSDQHRGWFQTSLLSALAMREKSPYKTVLTHGYVVDGKGYKMSKSVGNVISPSEVVKNMGADVLRLWAAATDHTTEIAVSNEILKYTADAYRRIRNTSRFLLSNLFDFDPQKDQVEEAQLLALDRWAIETTRELQQKIIEAFHRFHFQMIYQYIHNFCTVEMGSFYLDIIKDRAYTSLKNGVPRRSGQTAMYHILQALTRWLAPILSFTAEEIWRFMPGGVSQESIFLTTWYENFPKFKSKEKAIDWPWVMKVRDAVNKILESHRANGELGSALEAEIFLYADQSAQQKLLPLGDELRFILITSAAKVLPDSDRESSAEDSGLPGISVKVVTSKNQKCARCWQRREDIGKNKEYPDICERCVSNVIGVGETREIA